MSLLRKYWGPPLGIAVAILARIAFDVETGWVWIYRFGMVFGAVALIKAVMWVYWAGKERHYRSQCAAIQDRIDVLEGRRR